ncbi:MAG: DUF3426 domain-containing protein [Gammaproteobacteria bacterium]
MVTQCTACQVWFKVTREQLHAAHGLVRCSACGTVFNALATLRHGRPDTDFSPDDVSPPADEAGDEVPAEPPPVGVASETQEPRPRFDDFRSEVFEVEGESGTPLSEPAEKSTVDAEIPSLPESLQNPSPHRLRIQSRLWFTVLALALAALAGQIVYARRTSLAGLLGVTGGQAIALDRYTIADATLDGAPREPGVLVLSGKLLNRADRTQPLPLLRVTLTDRYGDVIGARMLTPRLYGAGTNAALKAHRRFMFHVKLADPGSSAVGFSLVLCKHYDRSLWCQGS